MAQGCVTPIMKPNFPYLLVVLATMLVLPVVCIGVENAGEASILKWFVFWGVGIRMALAGLRQVTRPGFTARTIFHMSGTESYVVIRELGVSNLTVGLAATASLFLPTWRVPLAYMGIFFFGVAGILHVIKRPAGGDEWIALVSDLWMSMVLGAALAL